MASAIARNRQRYSLGLHSHQLFLQSLWATDYAWDTPLEDIHSSIWLEISKDINQWEKRIPLRTCPYSSQSSRLCNTRIIIMVYVLLTQQIITEPALILFKKICR
uniref:Uncharacterized protein n=1 Tax=Heterorhabditis bacteriophora TaxID=37862 RepID=A0A1I7WBK9_HETBA